MKKKNNTHEPIATAKKHWIVYVVPSLLVFSGAILLSNGTVSLKTLGAALALAGVGLAVKRANEKWHLTENHLVMETGILPWFKNYIEVPVKDIYKTDFNTVKIDYKTSFRKIGLKRHFNSIGNISTKRRDMQCRGFSASYIAHPEIFTRKMQLHVQKQPEHSLNQLFELKEKGAISEHEFNIMKLGHITKIHLS
ncbi:hypothetical protein [Pararcticibacter amylolyticus]|uniref:Uncharacterized protein n=1 Tax=Pararcticibacter amylolyticus TaxID=2173175 RepID=A0A2U2PES0_9SPHI|nr:hypothetical protein [Pararcticibacter amylolyticus]PWG79814.1 hypothetical protein DDR33_15500 [Pararcticibacter amylolyticus]